MMENRTLHVDYELTYKYFKLVSDVFVDLSEVFLRVVDLTSLLLLNVSILYKSLRSSRDLCWQIKVKPSVLSHQLTAYLDAFKSRNWSKMHCLLLYLVLNATLSSTW